MPGSPLRLQELIENDSFIRWVLFTEGYSEWEAYLQTFPEQDPVVRLARKELVLIATGLQELAMEEGWQSLRRKIGEEVSRQPLPNYQEVTSQRPGHTFVTGRVHPLRHRWIWAAAACILLLGAGTWWFLSGIRSRPEKDTVAGRANKETIKEIQPGGNRAMLTLAGGQTILLDTAEDGTLARQGNTAIMKTSSGNLSYSLSVAPESGRKEVLNTLTTPRGGQYKVTLPDGTRVWLNAASTITYPTAFTGKERKVNVSGEAYFEVAIDKARPFRVHISPHAGNGGEADVLVLGTHFNIMAYDEEPETRATLLEGAVRIQRSEASLLLHPGEQARISKGGAQELSPIRLLTNIDTAQVTAWITGYFSFEDLDLPAILRQITRWYDVDLDDRSGDAFKGRRFGGRISRNLSLPGVLKLLEAYKINFRVEGKNLVVLP